MLSQQSIDIVKSTVPILQEHGETLTTHFYKRMFTHNPEVAPYFNAANQAAGLQQKALAGAICAYAANIDNLGALGGAVELIAQKHVSLMIKPEHYPIVGENLLASIREVLGEGATDDVINAWAEAYGALAGILTGREGEIYTQTASRPGGWEGFRPFRVERKADECSVITSLYLTPEDGGALPDWAPGQYLTLRVKTPDGSTTMRNYSLSDLPGQGFMRISVKKETGADADTPAGYVSNHLHQDIAPGDLLEVGPPCGEFTLGEASNRPLVLLAAGVGVTPLLSMLKQALKEMPGREIVFVHGCLNEHVQPFKGEIDELKAQHPNLTTKSCYSDHKPGDASLSEGCAGGFIEGELIESLVSSRDADYYFCGPKAFMIHIYRLLSGWNIPAEQIRFEFFGPKQELEASAG